MIVATEGQVGDGRTAFMPTPPVTLPLILRCPGEGASVRAQPGRPDTP